jgi:mRNA deadenylase 3'-5' endonuclease subunit Ccr4
MSTRMWIRHHARSPIELFERAAGRDLFPGSDCLKFKDRSDMLSEELLAYPADIICLQVRLEVQ